EEHARLNAVIRDAIKNKSLFELKHKIQRLDGSVGTVLSRAVPFMDANGEIIEWFVSAIDISNRKYTDEDSGHIC
ncbi:MAG: PAS domain-containing sensor histidine kinase, partial [Dehalococcoidia bacterium]